jgi:type VI secretion system protein ImpH
MADIKEYLEREACRLNFFGAVSMLEELFAREGGTDPITAGYIQFEPDVSLSFPPSDIVSIERQGDRYLFKLSFMGLTGISSPLPVYFSEYIVTHEAEAEALFDFLTIFNHRLYTLFYWAWKKYRLEHAIARIAHDPLLRCIAALSGIPAATGLTADTIRLLAYAGFGAIPVQVKEFMPRWAPMSSPTRLGRNAGLGTDAALGTLKYDTSGKFRVRIGPVSRELFESFLPNEDNYATVKRLVEGYMSDLLDYDIEVLLQIVDLVPVALGRDEARLGETAALGEPRGVSEVKSLVLEGRSIS